MPERAALLHELEAVRESLEDIRRVLPRQVEEKVAEVAVPRAEFRSKLRRNFWRSVLVTLAIVVVAVGINRVTLVQSRQDLTEQVTTCFLRPGAITPQQAAHCDERFSNGDHAYLRLQEQSRQATRRFTSLLKWAEAEGWKPPE